MKLNAYVTPMNNYLSDCTSNSTKVIESILFYKKIPSPMVDLEKYNAFSENNGTIIHLVIKT